MSISYKRHRFPIEIISYCVWLYYTFPLDLDEVVIKIKGKKYYLWRAVDKQGQVIDILVKSRRNEAAANKFFRNPLKTQQSPPRIIITEKLKSYGAAMKKILKGVNHRQHKGLNNRAENSHRPIRVRERRMGCFKSPGHAQCFLSAFEPIRGHFHPFHTLC